MVRDTKHGALTLIAGGLIALAASAVALDDAQAAEAVVRRPVPSPHAGVVRPRATRLAERPLTVRRRGRPVTFVGAEPGFLYEVPQHGWNDPRLYYFGPFRTGGDVFYGDQAGDPITRGNAGLGMIAGYGGARGGYGGPHFDAVGGFHDGPGPDAKIDADYASGSLSRPDYGDIVPRFPGVKARVASLDRGVVPRRAGVVLAGDRGTAASSEAAKAAFSAPMERHAPIEAAFANGGLSSIGLDGDADPF